jgi:hypothetical protein
LFIPQSGPSVFANPPARFVDRFLPLVGKPY